MMRLYLLVSIVTQKPSFTFGGNVEATYGNYDAKVLKGMITGPLSETVAVSLAGGINKRDGYNRDLGTGDRTNERDRWFIRGQMLFEPSNALSLRLIGDYGKIDENCCGVVNVLASPSTAILRALGGNVNPANDRFGNVVYGNLNSTNDIENWGLSLQADWKTGPVTITSITAIRKTSALTNQDSDFTSADLIGGNAQDLRIRTFTQELRAATDFDGPLNLLAGMFWFDESIEQTNQIYWGNAARPYANTLVAGLSGCALSIYPSACPTPGGPTPVPLENTFGQLDALAAGNLALANRYVGQFFKAGTGLDESYGLNNKALSLFGQADFEITDRLTFTGGISYTKDRKNYRLNVVSNDVFANVNFNAPQYAPFRQQLLYLGGLASQVGSALNLGRSATSAEITAFATNPATSAIYSAINTAVLAYANANQNNPAVNPLNALRPLQFLPPFLGVPNAVEPGRTRDSKVTYTARLAYDVTDDINVYLSYATGYKASSVNLSRDSRPSFADQAAITARGIGVVNQTYGSRFAAPETSTVYEAGIKANFGVDLAQAARVRSVALALYDTVAADADPEARRELGWACDLHEIGLMVSHHDHHRHSAYILAHADAPGFSQSQQRRVSALVLGQRGGLRKVEDQLASEAFAWQVMCLRLAVIKCHARGTVRTDVLSLRPRSRVAHLSFPAPWAETHPRTLYLLQQEAEAWGRAGPLELRLPGQR